MSGSSYARYIHKGNQSLRRSLSSMMFTAAFFRFMLMLVVFFSSTRAIPLMRSDAGQTMIRRSPLPAPTLAPSTLLGIHSTSDDLQASYELQEKALIQAGEATPSEHENLIVKRQEPRSVQVSALSSPEFPVSIPSCPKCEAHYSSLSSCMGAASVFANSTSILNNPTAYIDVIRCACTDTFQAVFPQCVDCFQATNQSVYLGTDPQATGASNLIGNIRQVCGFASALLGGVATANTNVTSSTPTSSGTHTDVTSTGTSTLNQVTGIASQSNAIPLAIPVHIIVTLLSIAVSVAVGGAGLFV